VDGIFLSGGVADAVYESGAEDFAYGDIGVLLGRSIRRSRLCTEIPLQKGETIRATVIGAGNSTVSLSGSTIFYRGGVFPRKNLPVLRLTEEEEAGGLRGDEGPLAKKIRWFLAQHDTGELVLALAGLQNPGYGDLSALAGALARAAGSLPPAAPLLVVIERDMAKALGQLLSARLPGDRPLAVLDSIYMGDNAYIDLGLPLMDGIVAPVAIKTLIFG
jgi:ethanolamine utilization protein EutA